MSSGYLLTFLRALSKLSANIIKSFNQRFNGNGIDIDE